MKRLYQIDEWLAKIIRWILAACGLLITIILFLSAIVRYFTPISMYGIDEIAVTLFVYSSALGSALLIRNRQHIGVTLALRYFPRRLAKMIVILNYLLIAVLSGTVIFLCSSWMATTSSIVSPVTHLPQNVTAVAVPLGFALSLFYCFMNILRTLTDPSAFALEVSGVDAEARENIEQLMEKEGAP